MTQDRDTRPRGPLPPYAVLAGDLVGSDGLPTGGIDAAIAALAQVAEEIARWAGGPVHFTRNRGDGWQIVLGSPALDLRAALAMRAALRSLGKRHDTRIALARGEARLAGGDLNAATGPAFTRAGHALDALSDLPAGRGGRIFHANGGLLHAATRLADEISQGWTPAQARAMALMLAPAPPTHAEAAKTLGIARPTVTKTLDSAHHGAVVEALNFYEGADLWKHQTRSET